MLNSMQTARWTSCSAAREISLIRRQTKQMTVIIHVGLKFGSVPDVGFLRGEDAMLVGAVLVYVIRQHEFLPARHLAPEDISLLPQE